MKGGWLLHRVIAGRNNHSNSHAKTKLFHQRKIGASFAAAIADNAVFQICFTATWNYF